MYRNASRDSSKVLITSFRFWPKFQSAKTFTAPPPPPRPPPPNNRHLLIQYPTVTAPRAETVNDGHCLAKMCHFLNLSLQIRHTHTHTHTHTHINIYIYIYIYIKLNRCLLFMVISQKSIQLLHCKLMFYDRFILTVPCIRLYSFVLRQCGHDRLIAPYIRILYQLQRHFKVK